MTANPCLRTHCQVPGLAFAPVHTLGMPSPAEQCINSAPGSTNPFANPFVPVLLNSHIHQRNHRRILLPSRRLQQLVLHVRRGRPLHLRERRPHWICPVHRRLLHPGVLVRRTAAWHCQACAVTRHVLILMAKPLVTARARVCTCTHTQSFSPPPPPLTHPHTAPGHSDHVIPY